MELGRRAAQRSAQLLDRHGRRGREPNAAPVWGVWADGAVRFSTNPRSRKGLNLARDPRVVIHLDSGDDVVILHGEVEPYELEDSIADAYEAKYDYRPETPGAQGEAWYRLRPRIAHAWRERDFPRTATRFTFDGTKGAGQEDRPGAAATS